MIGSLRVLDETKEQLERNGLVLKVSDSLQNNLSCKIRFSKDKKKALLGQPYLIENLKKKFDKQVMKAKCPRMPGVPKLMILIKFLLRTNNYSSQEFGCL